MTPIADCQKICEQLGHDMAYALAKRLPGMTLNVKIECNRCHRDIECEPIHRGPHGTTIYRPVKP